MKRRPKVAGKEKGRFADLEQPLPSKPIFYG
jgi:hypothetical protein